MEEPPAEASRAPDKSRITGRFSFECCVLFICVFTVGYIHYRYVSHLFERDRSFSYLSELEREMSLRTEMGFYYSYYKTVVEEKHYLTGIYKMLYDRSVEYPYEVNAFNRFNIHPEVMIGSAYRYLEPWLNRAFKKECHMIGRGGDHPPVESCTGLSVPIYFYLENIWVLAGVMVATLFLFATTLSNSIPGGMMAALQYFANHAECTRVQWAPNERENLAAPLLLLQCWLLTLQLRRRHTVLQLQIAIFTLNTFFCLIFWQFTQFIFLTQVAIFFIMEQCTIINTRSLAVFLHGHFCALNVSMLLLQGNDMLKGSLYTCFFFVVCLHSAGWCFVRTKVSASSDFYIEAFSTCMRISVCVFAAFSCKKIYDTTFDTQEDSHIWEILYSKFSNHKSFHSLIYTCSEVFDFLPLSSVVNMCKSLLIPFVLISCVNVLCYWIRNCIRKSKKELDEIARAKLSEDEDSGIENTDPNKNGTKKKSKKEREDVVMVYLTNFSVDPAIFYNISQMVVYGVMAVLVMRLKLLFSTHMCVVCSLIVNKRYYMFTKWMSKYAYVLWAIAIIPILSQLYVNINKEMSHVGEFNDYPQEQLLQWIMKQSGPGAFAGSMPVLATVMLTTRRPIVAHPHYEHFKTRERVYAVYKVYGKFSAEHLYDELKKLQATYLIVENKYCYGKSSRGCTFESIWDAEAPDLKSNPRLCHLLLTEPVDHFYPVFRNEHYAVFQLHDLSVRYMPRSFDT